MTMKYIFCTVETPKNSNAKYNYEPKCGGFVLAKYLPLGSVFPYDFGFIPGTVGEDGDPLDIIVISEQGTFPGCILKCRIIGAIKAIQQNKDGDTVENDRFLVVPEASAVFGHIHRVAQLPETVLDELQQFFINYNKQEGKNFQPLKILSAKDACKAIEKAKSNSQPIKKIELFLPLYDASGTPFSAQLFQDISKQLIRVPLPLVYGSILKNSQLKTRMWFMKSWLLKSTMPTGNNSRKNSNYNLPRKS